MPLIFLYHSFVVVMAPCFLRNLDWCCFYSSCSYLKEIRIWRTPPVLGFSNTLANEIQRFVCPIIFLLLNLINGGHWNLSVCNVFPYKTSWLAISAKVSYKLWLIFLNQHTWKLICQSSRVKVFVSLDKLCFLTYILLTAFVLWYLTVRLHDRLEELRIC